MSAIRISLPRRGLTLVPLAFASGVSFSVIVGSVSHADAYYDSCAHTTKPCQDATDVLASVDRGSSEVSLPDNGDTLSGRATE